MDSQSFGANLKRLREGYAGHNQGQRKGTLHLSQSKLAERADFDHSYISRLESGARMPTRQAVDLIIKALEVGPDEANILRASAGFMPDDLTALLNLPIEVAGLITALQDMPVEHIQDALAAVRAITRGLVPHSGRITTP